MIVSTWRISNSLVPMPESGDVVKPGYKKGHRFGLEDFSAGIYPSCSRHGAMQKVSRDADWWRCVEQGCNIGCIWDRLALHG